MMKVTLRLTSLLFGLFLLNFNAWAQPANDDCSGAFEVMYADDEASATLVAGDTRGATASTEPTSVCSGSWYTDDIWFKFTAPDVIPGAGVTIKAYFDQIATPSDVPAVGMALYYSCDPDSPPLRCFSSDQPADNQMTACLEPGHEYVVRIWSTGNTTATEGTLRVGVFANQVAASNYLWQETFPGGIEVNGWTTEGSCAVGDSNINAGWKFLPDGLLDKGAYIGAGFGLNSPTVCDGSVGVDSDYDDNLGDSNNAGGGPCPAPATHILTSPEINTSSWTAVGLSLTWTQAIRQYLSRFFIAYRVKDGDEDWQDWQEIEVNQEFPVNSNAFSADVQRHFLPGAAGHDFLQIRFTYNANYYMWGIDDVQIVETEANNLVCQTNFYAIPPWGMIPANQVYGWWAENDVKNVGAADQTNVVLNHTIMDTGNSNVVVDDNLNYGTIPANFNDENRIFPQTVMLPSAIASYSGMYSVTQDQTDYDPSDNAIGYNFEVGGSTFANETGFTRSVAVANGVYDDGAPLSYGYGNIFYPQKDVKVDRVVWGVANPPDMVDKTVNIYLIQWTDNNGDQTAQSTERKFVGYAEHTFDGSEGENAILESTLENFDNPGQDIIMKGGFFYFVMVEYVATDPSDPQFFLLSSDERNFNATTLASDSAYAHGISDYRIYMTVLQFSPDGIIANIDFEVRDLDPTNNTRIHFSDDIVPMIRIETEGVSTNEQLPSDNLITVYPNPATDLVQVKMDFTKSFTDVNLRLFDNQGRLVYYNQINQAFNQGTQDIHVSSLPAGNYMLQVETADGQRAIPVVVVK